MVKPDLTLGASLQIRVDLKSNGIIPLPSASRTALEFSTDFVTPTNGIKLPSTGGYYWIKVDICQFELTDPTGTSCIVIEKYSDFIFIYPQEFTSINVLSESKSANTFNYFQFQFQVSRLVPSYSNGGTIRLEFPTQQKDSTNTLQQAFLLDLGVSPS